MVSNFNMLHIILLISIKNKLFFIKQSKYALKNHFFLNLGIPKNIFQSTIPFIIYLLLTIL